MAIDPANSSDQQVGLNLLRTAVQETTATFWEGQWEAIDAVVNRRVRMLVVQRTGWGKSSVYFIATRLLRNRGHGPTLIVSPLLALMRNQIASALRHGVQAVRIDSTNQAEWPALKEAILAGKADALIVSPERLANEAFIEDLLLPVANTLGMLVIDEAHCISDWGHDFRPNYQRLRNIVQRIPPGTPLLATTATANDRVVRDVCEQLGNVEMQRGSLLRESLALQTLRLPSQEARLAWLSEHLSELPGTGIVYTLTKRDAERVASWLMERGIDAHAYYSGVEHADFADSNGYREHLERALERNEIKALVATTALGMGYDKPDLGFVVHFQAPGSVVAYYQQVGRAGRGIDRAVGVLMHGAEDDRILEYFRRTAFPSERHVQMVIQALAESDGLSARQLEREVNLRNGQIAKVLTFLAAANPAPVVKEGSTWLRTPVPYTLDRDHIARLTRQRELEWAEMRRYVDETGCLMRFLANALDTPLAEPCGKCASCVGRPVVSTAANRDRSAAVEYARRTEWPIDPKKQLPSGGLAKYGWANLAAERRHEVGRVLCQWGDGSWGAQVKQDKPNGRFRKELVDAMAQMIQERWVPVPWPEWVACVPSLARPNLVADFAKRVAAALSIPFLPVVEKVRQNEPQKDQQNRDHQCRNLDGVFRVVGNVPHEAGLLIDDVVDSGWTLAVVAALLLEAGSGPVFPVALASAAAGD